MSFRLPSAFPFWEITVINCVGNIAWGAFKLWRMYRRTFDPQPPALARFQSPEEYQKAQRYTRKQTRIFAGVFAVGFPLAFPLLAFKLKPMLLAWIQAKLPNQSFLVHSLIRDEILGWCVRAIAIPISFYSTFWVEEEFGLNRQTYGGFFRDRVKAYLVDTAIDTAITAMTYPLFDYFTPNTWAYLLGVGVIGGLGLGLIVYPRFIDPWFNTYKQLDAGHLRDRLETLATQVGFPNQNILVVDGSTRSACNQAYVHGAFGIYRIVISDTMLRVPDQVDPPFTEDEIVAVVGHELGHWKHGHALKSMGVTVMQEAVKMYLTSKVVFDSNIATSYGYPAEVHRMLTFNLASTFLSIPLGFLDPIFSWWSRRDEMQADRFAADLGYAAPLASALIKLNQNNLGNLNPDPMSHFLSASHPLISDRVMALESRKSD